ncbi:hypothetical protein F5Y15DRAFT_384773 [Xylariaceae sp. FL0016]|nr:hypothetical protein F5Y15DRAFT_384773 [Xylariaceae sp. FL0016]
MHTSIALIGILPSLSFGLALPLQARDTSEFNITGLSATFPYPGFDGVDEVDSYVSISVSYPAPASTDGAALSTTCRVDWAKGTDPGPTEWTPCVDTSMQFRLPADGWTNDENFRVELWEDLSDGSGLDASHILKAGPAYGGDPDAYMFCIQKGKFNPLTCDFTGPYGSTHNTVVMPTTEESTRPA